MNLMVLTPFSNHLGTDRNLHESSVCKTESLIVVINSIHDFIFNSGSLFRTTYWESLGL